jgi:hypothetical protein
MQTLLIKLSEDCRLITKESLADNTATSTSVINPGIQTRLENIDAYCDKLNQTIEFLMREMMTNLLTMKNTFLLGDSMIFVILFILSLILYKALWMPFVKNLEDRIWRAQGMVNMIPFEIIAENKELMKQMTKAYFN